MNRKDIIITVVLVSLLICSLYYLVPDTSTTGTTYYEPLRTWRELKNLPVMAGAERRRGVSYYAIPLAGTTTTDLALIKPVWTDNTDILDDLNANSDILESFANDPLEFDSDLERLEDRVGAMLSGNTETGLTLTYQDADNTIDAVIGANDIVESMIKFVNSGNDEEIVTRETTTGDFEYHTLAELGIQPLDAGLTSIAGLTTAANKSIYTTALDTYAVYDLSAFGRTIVDDADASAVRTTLGLVYGTNVQAYDAGLLSLAGLTYASDSFIKVTATDVYAIRTIAEVKTDLSLNNVSNVATDDTAYNATSWDANSDAATKNALRDKIEAIGGYTNLTEFVDQTAWRVFYSNTDGDIVELALGADGTYLESNGAAAAPTFTVPAGAGDVVKVGTPVNSQIGVWTGDGTIEGAATLTYDGTTLVVDGDITIGANHIGRDADNTIDFATDNHIIFKTNGATGMEVDSTGELDMNANAVGFTLQTATGDGTTTIDWKLGNKFKFTFGAANETFTFTAPTNPCTLMLTLIQDATGSRTATWPATVKWAGGAAPTLTTTANARDKVALDWDGAQYDGVCSKDFK